jgi:hypothetical protein
MFIGVEVALIALDECKILFKNAHYLRSFSILIYNETAEQT